MCGCCLADGLIKSWLTVFYAFVATYLNSELQTCLPRHNQYKKNTHLLRGKTYLVLCRACQAHFHNYQILKQSIVSYSALHKIELLKFKVLPYKSLKTKSSAQYNSYIHNLRRDFLVMLVIPSANLLSTLPFFLLGLCVTTMDISWA